MDDLRTSVLGLNQTSGASRVQTWFIANATIAVLQEFKRIEQTRFVLKILNPGIEWVSFVNPRPSKSYSALLMERDKCPYEFRYFVYPAEWFKEIDYLEINA